MHSIAVPCTACMARPLAPASTSATAMALTRPTTRTATRVKRGHCTSVPSCMPAKRMPMATPAQIDRLSSRSDSRAGMASSCCGSPAVRNSTSSAFAT
ncbi:hypothetical protein D9M68_777960 [compost metagenome]